MIATLSSCQLNKKNSLCSSLIKLKCPPPHFWIFFGKFPGEGRGWWVPACQLCIFMLTNWLYVISYQEQVVRLLVLINHKNKKELVWKARIYKIERRTYEYMNFFSFLRLCSKSAFCKSDITATLFKKLLLL